MSKSLRAPMLAGTVLGLGILASCEMRDKGSKGDSTVRQEVSKVGTMVNKALTSTGSPIVLESGDESKIDRAVLEYARNLKFSIDCLKGTCADERMQRFENMRYFPDNTNWFADEIEGSHFGVIKNAYLVLSHNPESLPNLLQFLGMDKAAFSAQISESSNWRFTNPYYNVDEVNLYRNWLKGNLK